MPVRFQSDMAALHMASNVFVAIVRRYELWRAIAKDHDFVAKIHNTKTAHAMNTIVGVLKPSLVVSLTALFDSDSNGVSLKRILNTLLQPEAAVPLERYHRTWRENIPVRLDTHDALSRHKRVRSRINRDPLGEAVSRLRDLRNQEAAHFSLQQLGSGDRAVNGDLDLVLAVAANVIVSCNLIAAGRHISASYFRGLAKTEANILRNSITPI